MNNFFKLQQNPKAQLKVEHLKFINQKGIFKDQKRIKKMGVSRKDKMLIMITLVNFLNDIYDIYSQAHKINLIDYVLNVYL